MGLSRRTFTKEFKLAAVRRLEQGVSIGEEVAPSAGSERKTCCIAGGESSARGQRNVFPGNGKQRWSEGRIAELERKIGQQQALEPRFF